jgi:ABC-type Fe3+ transport system substrate-binding protein
MTKNILILVAFAAVLIAPLALRRKGDHEAKADRTLVIITPHNEATRYEFSKAFDAWYFKKNGQHVHIDWRMPGGTSEISRYLNSEYVAAFQYYWTHDLHRAWNSTAQGAFDNAKAPKDDSFAGEARKAFLDSNVGCGIDLFFGGGSFDFMAQAAAGHLVDSGVIARHPEVFNEKVIPQNVGGEPYWDPQGRWVGACLAAFGICYNTDVLALLKIDHPPLEWVDLADPGYSGQLALANPTQSGSVAKAFEMLIQQQMLHVPDFKIVNFAEKWFSDEHGFARDVSEITVEYLKTGRQETVVVGGNLKPAVKLGDTSPEAVKVRIGWLRAMQLIQRIAANGRYFTDSGTKVPFDVEAGNAAAGMCIDFYGRFESESVRKQDGSSRMQYVTPEGGSSVGVDPIGMFRGAPNAYLARDFIEFVMSVDGQALWNWKVGTPNGPVTYALRRLPVRPELYAPAFSVYRSDPDVQPYAQAGAFQYHEAWTSPLFRVISFTVKAMCIDPHDEMRAAWQALIAAHFPPEATRTFMDVSKVDYVAANDQIRTILQSKEKTQKIDEMKLATALSESFRAQYRQAAELAREGK